MFSLICGFLWGCFCTLLLIDLFTALINIVWWKYLILFFVLLINSIVLRVYLYEAQKQIELEARKNAEKVRYEKYGFRNWEEVLSYLKEGNRIHCFDDTYSYDKEKNMIKHYHQVSDDNDCNFWYQNDFYTDKEFLDHHYDVDEMFDEYRRNEYGYIPNWFKYNELDNNFR